MNPMVVFPETLSRAFQEVQTYTARVCEYHDGSAQQGAMVSAPRHAWRLTKRLPPPADLVALRDFVHLPISDTFFFYNPKECVPPYVGNPTGVATAGRYAVRVNSDWSQSCGIALTDAVVELIEVASMTVLMNTWITLSPVKGLSAPGTDLAPPISILLAGDGYAFRCETAVARSKRGSTGSFDVLYLPPGASEWVSIFPSVSGGIEIDGGRVTDFALSPTDLPNDSQVRLDCLSLDSLANDEFSVQIRGDVVSA